MSGRVSRRNLIAAVWRSDCGSACLFSIGTTTPGVIVAAWLVNLLCACLEMLMQVAGSGPGAWSCEACFPRETGEIYHLSTFTSTD